MKLMLLAFLAKAAADVYPQPETSLNPNAGNRVANPTHYGPCDACQSDEGCYTAKWQGLRSSACIAQEAFKCNSTSCPTDKPSEAQGDPFCAGDGCYIKCKEDSDCGSGATCAREVGECWYFSAVDRCYYIEATQGKWEQIQSSSSNQTVQFEEGITRGYTVQSSTTWGAQATASVSSGFKFFGLKESIDVTGEISTSVSQQYSSTFSMSTTVTHGFAFGPGVVWQWQFTISDGCGATTGSGHDLTLTSGAFAPPCCLPGYFEDITKPHGACHSGPNICNSTSSVKNGSDKQDRPLMV